MTTIGYHCSHEQYPPSRLLHFVRLAESAGFQAAMCSDHFHPWSQEQGHSGFAWCFLGAALQATGLPFGIVTVPGGWRYHPAILAQAGATLAEMFPDRFWMAVGSGEALNEHIVGQHWPAKAERNARLQEAVEIMRALWAGETVTHRGRLVVEEARLYSRPARPPAVIGAALTADTAGWMGRWADGLVTTVGPRDSMRRLIEAFRQAGGEAKPVYLQAQLSFARTEEEARRGVWEQWRMASFPSPVLSTLRMPEEFDSAAQHVRPEDLPTRVSSDPGRHLEWLRSDVELGFSQIHVHNVHRGEQERFIEVFGEKVLPALRC